MSRRHRTSGFSLIEMLIVVGIIGVIMGIGFPMMSDTIRNAKIRARAENVLWGLQQARTEALKRNATVRHQFVDNLAATCALSTAGPYWVVSLGTAVGTCDSAVGAVILGKSDPVALGTDGGSADGIVVTAGSSLYCFTSLGQLTATSCTSGAVTGPIVSTNIDITAPNAGACRATTAGTGVACMRITVRSGGLVRMCDPAIDPNGTDSRRCIP